MCTHLQRGKGFWGLSEERAFLLGFLKVVGLSSFGYDGIYINLEGNLIFVEKW